MEGDHSSSQGTEFLHLIQTSLISLSKNETQQFIVAQQTNLDIQKLADQSKIELKWQKLQLFPQGILYRIEDGHEQMLVPQSLRQKIMKEHHDVPIIGHMCRELWSTSNELFGMAYRVMSVDMCYPIRFAN